MRVPFAILALVAMFLGACGVGVRAEGDAPDPADVSRAPKVLAFYYGWYSTPDVSGGWGHWSGVDRSRHRIADATQYPFLGPYDTHDPAVLDKHCAWAREGGLDGLIATWWRQGDFHDAGMAPLLGAAQKHGLSVSVHYEEVPAGNGPAGVEADLEYILARYAGHPAWLRHDGKPVLFIYNRALVAIPMEDWDRIVKSLAKRHPPGIVVWADLISDRSAEVFNGLFAYGIPDRLVGKSAADVEAATESFFQYEITLAKAAHCLSAVTVTPGYDDRKIRKPGLYMERHDGESYKAQWRAAVKLLPDCVLVTSFNEWHEGTEIEPSLEFGTRYLGLTREEADAFRKVGAERR